MLQNLIVAWPCPENSGAQVHASRLAQRVSKKGQASCQAGGQRHLEGRSCPAHALGLRHLRSAIFTQAFHSKNMYATNSRRPLRATSPISSKMSSSSVRMLKARVVKTESKH